MASYDLTVSAPLSGTLQQVAAGGVNSLLYLSNSRVQVTGGGAPPLFVQGSSQNYAMLGLQGDGAQKDWQLQATNTGGSFFRVAYGQNNPLLVIQQNGDTQVSGTLTARGLNLSGPLTLPGDNFHLANVPTLPSGVRSADLVVTADGRVYKQGEPTLKK
jgi:hypothetical protein